MTDAPDSGTRRMAKHGTAKAPPLRAIDEAARKNTGDQAFEGTFPGCTITGDDLEFVKACERYQRENNRRFPTFTEILRVAKSLGYRKVEKELMPPFAGEWVKRESIAGGLDAAGKLENICYWSPELRAWETGITSESPVHYFVRINCGD